MSYFEDKASKQSGRVDDLLNEEVQDEDFVFIVDGVTGELKSVFCPQLPDNTQVNSTIIRTLNVFGIDELGGQPKTVH